MKHSPDQVYLRDTNAFPLAPKELEKEVFPPRICSSPLSLLHTSAPSLCSSDVLTTSGSGIGSQRASV